MEKELRSAIKQFIHAEVNETPVAAKQDVFWQNLRNTGTELWLDTGDMEEAARNWTAEMTALTTNNTLLNAEIQKGIYDTLIKRARDLVSDFPLKQQVVEIAFILNGVHGLRLARRFGGFVSVELHTDTAHDLEAIYKYGMRYADICPEQFIIKVPFTATGLLGARQLHEKGVRINFTLEFSARQNLLVTAIAQPDFVNVFLGRIGAYIRDNKLGSGEGAGERAVLAAQQWVRKMAIQYGTNTRLIAASLRNAGQLESLAGTDVFTMPVKVAETGRTTLSGDFKPKVNEKYDVDLNERATGCQLEKLWEVNEKELMLVRDLADEMPCCSSALVEIATRAGCGDLFPSLSAEELAIIAADGKIPVHERWENRIRSGELAVDSLLTLAGLASFTHDQAQLDQRIASIISTQILS
jgi:transaldolase